MPGSQGRSPRPTTRHASRRTRDQPRHRRQGARVRVRRRRRRRRPRGNKRETPERRRRPRAARRKRPTLGRYSVTDEGNRGVGAERGVRRWVVRESGPDRCTRD